MSGMKGRDDDRRDIGRRCCRCPQFPESPAEAETVSLLWRRRLLLAGGPEGHRSSWLRLPLHGCGEDHEICSKTAVVPGKARIRFSRNSAELICPGAS